MKIYVNESFTVRLEKGLLCNNCGNECTADHAEIRYLERDKDAQGYSEDWVSVGHLCRTCFENIRLGFKYCMLSTE